MKAKKLFQILTVLVIAALALSFMGSGQTSEAARSVYLQPAPDKSSTEISSLEIIAPTPAPYDGTIVDGYTLSSTCNPETQIMAFVTPRTGLAKFHTCLNVANPEDKARGHVFSMLVRYDKKKLNTMDGDFNQLHSVTVSKFVAPADAEYTFVHRCDDEGKIVGYNSNGYTVFEYSCKVDIQTEKPLHLDKGTYFITTTFDDNGGDNYIELNIWVSTSTTID